MLTLNNNTKIAVYEFDFLQSVEIRSSWDTLTDTATLLLPKKISYTNRLGVITKKITGKSDGMTGKDFPVFLQGDPVTLSGGYGDDVPDIFTGYIRAVAPNHPIKIDFEDNMYWLKNLFIEKYSEKDISLKQVIEDITEGMPDHIELNVVDGVQFEVARYSAMTVAEILQSIKKIGLVSWFRDDTLNVGLAYLEGNPKIHRFFGSGKDVNIISTDNLEYKTEDQVKIKLKVTSIYKDNTKISVTVGNVSGENRTAFVYGIAESGLETIANEMLKKMVYEGYTGYFTTFLQPKVIHGDAVKLSDPEFPDRDGTYLVKEVITNYGIEGGRQKITLDRKI